MPLTIIITISTVNILLANHFLIGSGWMGIGKLEDYIIFGLMTINGMTLIGNAKERNVSALEVFRDAVLLPSIVMAAVVFMGVDRKGIFAFLVIPAMAVSIVIVLTSLKKTFGVNGARTLETLKLSPIFIILFSAVYATKRSVSQFIELGNSTEIVFAVYYSLDLMLIASAVTMCSGIVAFIAQFCLKAILRK